MFFSAMQASRPRISCAAAGNSSAASASTATAARILPLVGIVFGAAEMPTLEAVADRVGRQPALRRRRLGAEILGLALRLVAVTAGVAVVPPARLVVGAAVENLEPD